MLIFITNCNNMTALRTRQHFHQLIATAVINLEIYRGFHFHLIYCHLLNQGAGAPIPTACVKLIIFFTVVSWPALQKHPVCPSVPGMSHAQQSFPGP